jgi:hypothetical protein
LFGGVTTEAVGVSPGVTPPGVEVDGVGFAEI